MNRFWSLALLPVLLVVGAAAMAQKTPETVNLDVAAEFIAQKERDAARSESSLAPIRSRSELATYLQQRQTTPFDALSSRSRRAFVDGLMFTESGLASYRYRELELELTPRQAFELLSLFGAQKTVGRLDFANASTEERQALAKMAPVLLDDHKGYRCVPPATCQSSMDHICIGANCGIYPW